MHAEVWLTEQAVNDLIKLDGSAMIWALKKLLILERNPQAGQPLLGGLIGWRKLVVSARDWRIIWRATTNQRGHVVIEVAEVWAVGARSDNDVYDEIKSRLASKQPTPALVALAAAIERLGAEAKVEAAPPAPPTHGPESWLIERLVYTAGLPRDAVEAMTSEQAVDAWTAYTLGISRD
ncbi:MAG: hypothetical protein HQ526_05540 [Actinobacteria bacterium]|nr:hypothetical protein [Actinomycetota bacterium]